MAVTINSNISSAQILRRLDLSTRELASTYERLSSGQRINKSADDAAGLAVSESLLKDSRVFLQGVRNLNDGLSALNIADGALDQLSTITIRLKELAAQAANGSLSTKQRQSLDQEAQSLSKEYFRIAKTTTFNGRKLFEGSYGELRLQAGYGLDGGIAQGLGGAIGTGTFGGYSTYSAQDVGPMVSADFNGDGIMDIAAQDGTSDRVRVLLGIGDGTFKSAMSTSASFAMNGHFLETADFNNDGILDLAVDQGNTGFGIYLGNGDGTFKAYQSFDSIGYTGLSTTDFNNDGAMDVVLVSPLGTSVSVMFGTGTGSFGAEISFTVGDDPQYSAVGDFNNDGNMDFAVSVETDDEFSIFLGRGDGTFNSKGAFATPITSPNEIAVADLNNDGNQDLITIGKSVGTTVGIMFGTGDGSFSAGVSVAAAAGTTDVIAADLNGDGNMDIITAGATNETISILLGNGNGTFQTNVSYATNADPISVITGDFNSDGVLDIAASSLTSDTVSIHIGNTVDGVSPLLQFSLRTQADSLQALSIFDKKIGQLAQQRGEIGAFQARIGVGMSTLQFSSENALAAAGRIRDADIADESSRLMRLGILQQAGAAVLGQANLSPALALLLLE